MGTRYNVSGAGTPELDVRVTWLHAGVTCLLLDDGYILLLSRGAVEIDVIPGKDGRLVAWPGDQSDLGLDDATWAELGRQARRALAVRRAAVTRALAARRVARETAVARVWA